MANARQKKTPVTRITLVTLGLALFCVYLFQQVFTLPAAADSSLVSALLLQSIMPLTILVCAIAIAVAFRRRPASKVTPFAERASFIAFAVIGTVGIALNKFVGSEGAFYVGGVLATAFYAYLLYAFLAKASSLTTEETSVACLAAPAIACLVIALQVFADLDTTPSLIVSPLIAAALFWPLCAGKDGAEAPAEPAPAADRKPSPASSAPSADRKPSPALSAPAADKAPLPAATKAILVILFLFSLICALLSTSYVLLVPEASFGNNAADPVSRSTMYFVSFVFFVVGLALFAIFRKKSIAFEPFWLFMLLCVFMVCSIFVALANGLNLDQHAVMAVVSIRTAVEGTALFTLGLLCCNKRLTSANASALLLVMVATSRLVKIGATCAGELSGVAFNSLVVPFALSAAFCIIALIAVAVRTGMKTGASAVGATPYVADGLPASNAADAGSAGAGSASAQLANASEAAKADPASPNGAVRGGQAGLPEAVRKTLKEQFELTERELEVANCLFERLSTEEGAQRLFISTSTLYTHQKRIYRKTGVHSKKEFLEFLDQIS